MRPVAASDFNPFGGIVFVDWMRLSPIATPGAFESRVFDATALVNWKSIQWQADAPAGTIAADQRAHRQHRRCLTAIWTALAADRGTGPAVAQLAVTSSTAPR